MALRATLTKDEWIMHFNSIGIPDEYAEKYAVTFHSQQLQLSLLKYIEDVDLRNIYGIQLQGHILAIKHSMDQIQPPAISVQPTSHRPQIRHQSPQLQPTMNPSSFRAFITHWDVYKGLVGIVSGGVDSAAQLFSLACTDHPEIRQTIADHKPDHLRLHESEYLEMLRRLLTAKASPESYRNKFFTMTQNPGETCQQWLKRLQEVVPDCEFSIPCSEKSGVFHKFGENLLRTKFMLGTYDDNIRQVLLTKSSQLVSLDDVFNHATQMEATSRDMVLCQKTIAEVRLREDQISTSSDEEVNKISTYKKSRKQQGFKGGYKKATRYHKPLLGIFNRRELGSIKNPRIRRIKENTLDYQFDIKHCPGKLHCSADALSRHPIQLHTVSCCTIC